jgi:O-antigen/teichoic acid export membrane protein
METSQAVQAAPVSRRRILKNFSYLSLAAIVAKLASLVTGVYARRRLGVDAIGEVGFTAAIFSYFSLLTNPGLETIAKREVAAQPSQATAYVSRLFSLQIILAGVSMALVGVFAILNFKGPHISLLLFLQSLAMLLVPVNLGWLLYSQERMALPSALDIANQIVMLPLILLFITGPSRQILFVVIGYPLKIAVILIFAIYCVRLKLFDWRKLRFTLQGTRELMKHSIPLAMSQVAILVYYNIDSIFLGFMKGASAVGYYQTAYNLMLLPAALSNTMVGAFYPALARARSHETSAASVSRLFLKALAWIGIPAAMLGWAAGRHIIPFLFTHAFAESGPMYEWLSLDTALIFINIGLTQPLVAWGHEKKILAMTSAAGIANIVLNCIVIPKWGAYGAIATTILSEVIVLGFGIAYRRKIVPIAWPRMLAAPIAASVASGLVLRALIHFFPHYWLPFTIAGGLAVAAAFCAAEWSLISDHLLSRVWANRRGVAEPPLPPDSQGPV